MNKEQIRAINAMTELLNTRETADIKGKIVEIVDISKQYEYIE